MRYLNSSAILFSILAILIISSCKKDNTIDTSEPPGNQLSVCEDASSFSAECLTQLMPFLNSSNNQWTFRSSQGEQITMSLNESSPITSRRFCVNSSTEFYDFNLPHMLLESDDIPNALMSITSDPVLSTTNCGEVQNSVKVSIYPGITHELTISINDRNEVGGQVTRNNVIIANPQTNGYEFLESDNILGEHFTSVYHRFSTTNDGVAFKFNIQHGLLYFVDSVGEKWYRSL